MSGEPALNGGAGLYSMPSWIASAVCRLASIDTSVRAKSMPAVTPPPVMRLRSTQTRVCDRRRAECGEMVDRGPMGRGAIAIEQAGGAEHQGAGADRGDVFAPRPAAQESEHLLVIDHVVDADTAGHADHIELRAIGKASWSASASERCRSRTGSMRFQIRCTFAPGRADNTCSGPVRSSWVTFRKQQQTDLQRRRPSCSPYWLDGGHQWHQRPLVRNGIFPLK